MTRKTQGGERRRRIAEELDRRAGIMNPLFECAGAPVVECRRAVEEKPYRERAGGRAESQPCSITINTRNLPSTNESIQPTGNILPEQASAAKRKVIDPVDIDEMPDI